MRKVIQIVSRAEETEQVTVNINEICKTYRSLFHYANREKIVVFLLDDRSKVFAFEQIMEGSLEHSTVAIKEILRAAVRYDAEEIIIAHNHVKGELVFSEDDIDFTGKVADACNIIGIPLVDHILFHSVKRECLSLVKTLKLEKENEDL